MLGNYAPAGSNSASACQNTKSVCPNIPIFAEMADTHLTEPTCGLVMACTANTQVLACNGDYGSCLGRPATCIDCSSSSCLMNMEFTAKLYLTSAEFDNAMRLKFRDAVQEALGAAVLLPNVTIVNTTTSTASQARKSETITVTTKVALSAGSGTRGTASSPGLTFAYLKAAMISKAVTRTVPSEYLPAGWGTRFDNSSFTDQGSLLELTVTKYTDLSPCRPGFTGQIGSCVSCPSGKYKPSVGSATCTDCEPGKVSSGQASVCTTCEAGKYATGNLCTLCQAGKYKTSAGPGVCVNCEAGKFKASTGPGSCTACGPNSNSIAGSSACTCNAGFSPPNCVNATVNVSANVLQIIVFSDIKTGQVFLLGTQGGSGVSLERVGPLTYLARVVRPAALLPCPCE